MANEKQQFVDELKELLQKNVAEVKEQVEGLKMQFYRQYHQELEAQKKAALEAAQAAGEVLENWLPQIDELEQEFRELLAQYKQRRAEIQKQVEEEQAQNLLRKENILAQMKEMADAETADVMDNLKKMRELQAEWKKVGPVARKYSDELWKKFTAACDTFFEAKREATKELREQYAQKRAEAKERWNKKVDGMNDRQKLIRMYENLQQEIKTAENNILFFTGKTKSANKLVDDMQKKIEVLKGQLKDLENKINQLN